MTDFVILKGDGIGPEVMTQALKVLTSLEKRFDFSLSHCSALIGGAAIDQTGFPLPDETKEKVLNSKAVLLGSIGGPKWSHLPSERSPEIGGLLALRKLLGLSINLRPAILYQELKGISPLSSRVLDGAVDILTIRELASGIYFGTPRYLDNLRGSDTMIYHREEIEVIARFAFEAAKSRGGRVTSVDKANVLSSSKLWRSVVTEIHSDFPEVELDHMYVDNAAMQLMLNPRRFDVILTSNLFGDILSDESAAICGSLGMLPSASLGGDWGLYEPAGGSAPDIAGKDVANPIAQILSLAMMLENSFGLSLEAEAVREAVHSVIASGLRTADTALKGDRVVGCEAMGDAVAAAL